MQVVSDAMGKERVHYEAVPAKDVKPEMNKFFLWLNDDKIIIDSVLKSAIAHFWFIIIHPFDDGNGRMARADMLLARSEKNYKNLFGYSTERH